jgi:hypothetical protein
MRKRVLALMLLLAALGMSTAAFADEPPPAAVPAGHCGGYPERPGSARVQYELWYFPIRLISMVSAIAWDVPTGAAQGAIKGALGFSKMVAKNLGNENGCYEMIAGGLVGGPVGIVEGSAYGLVQGFGYGTWHGFVGYPSPNSGSHSMLFQGMAYRVPYDDNY